MFLTNFEAIQQLVTNIQPADYGRTRNFLDGDVTRLSPYISRGVISTKYVFRSLLNRGYNPLEIERLIQELAWRDYWQQIWIEKGNLIDEDFKSPQMDVENRQIPKAIIEGKTGIEVVDKAISEFYETGYLHNHLRLYIASITCNVAKSHWKLPAKWLYYHLLDGDWASNALSWQWVAGTNSNNKYFANQENINKFFYSDQKGTFLDIGYDAFPLSQIPESLQQLATPALLTILPNKQSLKIDFHKPTLLYNFYNLDPLWKKDVDANRILLLEPSHFAKYPVSGKTIDFILALGENIENLQIYTGNFDDLVKEYQLKNILFKEHPTNSHYQGTEESRDWMFDVSGYYESFFRFWKLCKKEISTLQNL
ncbi:FAD-binding domain-containing protein [Dyadobacter sp. 3J3]|uniref:FAD-binding domain-containing protein n=1 Tax=Dyadobacter sp. 3J3 TaxID=2606600 RepID=UPI00135A7611|nr:FAD-binding domain-containing protein [Dyadobacter sp. 3J3]